MAIVKNYNHMIKRGKFGFIFIFLLILVITLIPIFFFQEEIIFDKAMYATEWIKTVVTILVIVFSLMLTIILENKREMENNRSNVIDKIDKLYIATCDNILLEFQALKENNKINELNKINLHSLIERFNKIKLGVNEVEIHLTKSNSRVYSELQFIYDNNSKKLGFFIKDILEKSDFNVGDLEENIAYIIQIKEKLTLLKSSLN